jgi:hypothetical protein
VAFSWVIDTEFGLGFWGKKIAPEDEPPYNEYVMK